jgi:hypothetical protein
MKVTFQNFQPNDVLVQWLDEGSIVMSKLAARTGLQVPWCVCVCGNRTKAMYV